MSLENIYYVSQTLAVIAILVSLLALLYQARLATAQFQQANLQARAGYSRDFANRLADLQLGWLRKDAGQSTMKKALLTKAILTKAERVEFSSEMAILFSQLMSAEHLLNLGWIEAEYEHTRKLILKWYLSFPRVRCWWRSMPDSFFPNETFTRLVEDILLKETIAEKRAKSMQGAAI